MPLPPAEETCPTLDLDIFELLGLSIDLPGGMQIRAKLEPGEIPSLATIVGRLLSELNAALAPLAPIFVLIEVVTALIDCAKALPDALGPPPDPTTIIACLKKLLKAAAKLVKLLPPLSIPVMILGICRVVLAALKALREQLVQIITVQAELDLKSARAEQLALDPELVVGAAALQISLDCATANLDLQQACNAASMGPLNKLLEVFNVFSRLVSIPEFAKIELGGDAAAALAPLDAAIVALDVLCGKIPV